MSSKALLKNYCEEIKSNNDLIYDLFAVVDDLHL